jgi:hypothetical protein
MVLDFVSGLHVLHPAVHVHARQYLRQPDGHVGPEVRSARQNEAGIRPEGHQPTRLPLEEKLKLPASTASARYDRRSSRHREHDLGVQRHSHPDLTVCRILFIL